MAYSTIKQVVDGLQVKMATVSGITSAPAYPPEQAADFPFVIGYPGKFKATPEAGPSFKPLWALIVEFHLARKDLPADVKKALEMSETLINAMMDDLMANQVAFKGIEGDFAEMVWGDVQTIGYRFVINEVKLITSVT